MRETVALTGATGFVGGHIMHRLLAGDWRVRALVRRPRAVLPRGVEAVAGDMADADALRGLLEGASVVVHCAGLVRARRGREFHTINAGATARLAAIAAAAPRPPRFILLSSLAARLPEISPYAASKRAGEEALRAAGGDLPWTILRPSAVYGPGDRATLPFFRGALRGVVPTPRGVDGRVSLIHADDLARAVVAVVSTDGLEGAIFETDDGCEGGYSWRTIAAAAGQAVDRQVRCVPLPRSLMTVAAGLNLALGRALGRAPMVTPGKIRELFQPDWVCHGEPPGRRTGWRPVYGIHDGFRQTVDWYRQAGWLPPGAGRRENDENRETG